MKVIILLSMILLSTVTIFAQNKNAENTVQNFLIKFNEGKYDDIYTSFSPDYQQKISKKDLQLYLSRVYGMAGKFKSATFKALIDGNYNYFLIAYNKGINADFVFTIDQNYKLSYINFKRIGGTGSPPAVSKLLRIDTIKNAH